MRKEVAAEDTKYIELELCALCKVPPLNPSKRGFGDSPTITELANGKPSAGSRTPHCFSPRGVPGSMP